MFVDSTIEASGKEREEEEPKKKKRRTKAPQGEKSKVSGVDHLEGTSRQSPQPSLSSFQHSVGGAPLRELANALEAELTPSQGKGPLLEAEMTRPAAAILWSQDGSVACMRMGHHHATESMGGQLNSFTWEIAGLIRSEADVTVRGAWPRGEMILRVMQHSLDAFNSSFYLIGVLTDHVKRLRETIKALEAMTVVDKAALN